MFVCNIKLNKNSLLKWILCLFIIAALALLFASCYKIYSTSKNEKLNLLDECLPNTDIANIKPENYTNILKMVNDDLNSYIGQKICFTGYVYRVSDIKPNEFVLARDMIVSNNPKQTVVVGFLSKCNNASEYENGTWVKVTATITKGTYITEVPLLDIESIEKTSKPDSPEVPLPDDYYIPTAVIY